MRLTIFALWISALLPTLFLSAQDESEEVSVLTSEVFEGDYYALGDMIEVAGLIKGNAYLAGAEVSVLGEIEGDLFVAAGNLEIMGQVGGSVIGICGEAHIEGKVLKNLTLLSANPYLDASAMIHGDLILCAGNGDLSGRVEGKSLAFASDLKIEGEFAKNVRVFAGKLRIEPRAHILGELKYNSNEKAIIDPRAQIDGGILYDHSVFRDLVDSPLIRGLIIGSKIAAFFMNFCYTLIMAMILIRLFPRKVSGALFALQNFPLKCLWYGVILLVLFPLAALVLLATVIGAPFALTIVALNIISLYTAKIFTILWTANFIFCRWKWRKNGLWTFATGQVLYSLCTELPFVGPAISLGAMLFGLGAIAISQTLSHHSHHTTRSS